MNHRAALIVMPVNLKLKLAVPAVTPSKASPSGREKVSATYMLVPMAKICTTAANAAISPAVC